MKRYSDPTDLPPRVQAALEELRTALEVETNVLHAQVTFNSLRSAGFACTVDAIELPAPTLKIVRQSSEPSPTG